MRGKYHVCAPKAQKQGRADYICDRRCILGGLQVLDLPIIIIMKCMKCMKCMSKKGYPPPCFFERIARVFFPTRFPRSYLPSDIHFDISTPFP